MDRVDNNLDVWAVLKNCCEWALKGLLFTPSGT